MNTLGGLILAGGEGRRMGYKNKGLVPFGNAYFVDYMLNILKSQCSYIAISANQDIDDYKSRNVDVWSDHEPWLNLGPLGGICSSVSQFPLHIDTIQVVPCDSPFLTPVVIHTLYQQLNQLNCSAVYATTPNQIYPVTFQFKRHLLLDMQKFLRNDSKYSVRQWLQEVDAKAVNFNDDYIFTNINDMDSLQIHQPSN